MQNGLTEKGDEKVAKVNLKFGSKFLKKIINHATGSYSDSKL